MLSKRREGKALGGPLHAYIQTCILEYHWSPEEIVGQIQLEHGCRLEEGSTQDC